MEKRPARQDGGRSTELDRTESAAQHSHAGLGSSSLRCCTVGLFQIWLQLPRSRAAERGEAGCTAGMSNSSSPAPMYGAPQTPTPVPVPQVSIQLYQSWLGSGFLYI